jgi:hypothetical protein
MIDRTEILRLANELGPQARVVEKSNLLGWILAGIAPDEELARAWLFKSGRGRGDPRDVANEEAGGRLRPRAAMVHTVLAGQLNGARV